ncbi:MAG: agmatine deiminase family protein [Isosphaeraceae bacterium]
MIPTATPSDLGFRFPAEWEPHAATWLAWPHNREDWPGKFSPIPWAYAEIVRLLARSETVEILVRSRRERDEVAERLERAGADMNQVRFLKARTDRVWTRDSGPMFVVRDHRDVRQVGAVRFGFNGWAKYDNHKHDARVSRKIAEELGIHRWRAYAEVEGEPTRVVLEGGAIDVNGLGTLLTTEECLLSDVQARNPGLGREGIERVFARYLGVRHTIWLNRGIIGDDTHGHVDDLARFVGPNKVVIAQESDPSDPNHDLLRENWERLRDARDQDGHPLEVIPLPMPRPVVFDGQRLPASYANFYIANRCVIVPTFNDPADRIALATLAGAFPDRDVVGVHAVDLVWGLGTLHCLTREQPKGEPFADKPESEEAPPVD